MDFDAADTLFYIKEGLGNTYAGPAKKYGIEPDPQELRNAAVMPSCSHHQHYAHDYVFLQLAVVSGQANSALVTLLQEKTWKKVSETTS